MHKICEIRVVGHVALIHHWLSWQHHHTLRSSLYLQHPEQRCGSSRFNEDPFLFGPVGTNLGEVRADCIFDNFVSYLGKSASLLVDILNR